MAKRIIKPQPIEKPTSVSFETFREIGSYWIHSLTENNPSCFNGNVSVRKYRVTIELVEEPNEVIAERIQLLWDKCDNLHHWTHLRIAAQKIGYELKGSPGNSK